MERNSYQQQQIPFSSCSVVTAWNFDSQDTLYRVILLRHG